MNSEQSPFQPTRWSLVAEAGGTDEAAARAALESLCAAYWYPLYAYVRRKGRGPEDAADAVQGFFVRLLERDYFAAASRERGKLRTFLMNQMDCWLADEARHRTALKRGGGMALLCLDDAEARYAAEPATHETPVTLYERRWALTILTEALKDLEQAWRDAGRAVSFALLKPALTEPTAAALDTRAVSEQLGIPRDQVRTRVHRLRREYREILLQRIAATVHTSSREELDEELRELLSALRA